MHLVFVIITPQTNVTITCGIQPTGVVTMEMKVFHNTCNMCIHDLSDINALIPQALVIHIRQTPHAQRRMEATYKFADWIVL